MTGRADARRDCSIAMHHGTPPTIQRYTHREELLPGRSRTCDLKEVTDLCALADELRAEGTERLL
jgi:hypothetical protein